MKYVSIVVPVLNQAENMKQLTNELIEVCNDLSLSYELIFINDGTKDGTQQVLEKLYRFNKQVVRVIQFRNTFGKAAALRAGGN